MFHNATPQPLSTRAAIPRHSPKNMVVSAADDWNSRPSFWGGGRCGKSLLHHLEFLDDSLSSTFVGFERRKSSLPAHLLYPRWLSMLGDSLVAPSKRHTHEPVNRGLAPADLQSKSNQYSNPILCYEYFIHCMPLHTVVAF